MTEISIIIPVYKEKELQAFIHHVVNKLTYSGKAEFIVVDYSESSKQDFNNVLYLNSPKKGRSCQMNFGAEHANGKILYFLHADSYPPRNFDELIFQEYDKNIKAGCFKMQFDTTNYFLRFFGWFTRFNSLICRGGDQSLFIEKEMFEMIQGFDEEMIIMEDIEIIKRIKEKTRFSIIKSDHIVTSIRKYKANGIYRLQVLFGLLHFQRILGRTPKQMSSFYKKHIVSN